MNAGLVKALASLRLGETVPFSQLPEEWVEELLAEGYVSSIVHGSRKSLKARSLRAFDVFIRSKGLNPNQLQETVEVLSEPTTRAVQVQLLGDSKAMAVRSCTGFPVNVTEPLSVRLGERKILLCNCSGTFLYISDFWSFRIPSDITVVGVENMENFCLVERHGDLFESLESRLIFVSRYPQSKDLVTWLQTIPNPYVHFGDFDLAGIHIYLTEFYVHLKERATFFVPEDIEERLSVGSRERYDTQFPRLGKMDVPDARVLPLVRLIHRYQRGYDQEGYIVRE